MPMKVANCVIAIKDEIDLSSNIKANQKLKKWGQIS